jgi:GMP synthase-like glutamine amidotransferase
MGSPIRSFAECQNRFNALQWHSVAVRQPPEGAEVLANSPICGCQAMRVGKCAWGLQYHVEIEETTVSEWAAIPAYSEALKRSLGSDALERMQAAARSHLPQLAAHSEQLFQNFLHAVRS